MRRGQLSLVVDEVGTDARKPVDVIGEVFSHWVWMFGKNPRRCALGPTRRRAIMLALSLYDGETLKLAIDGCAASAWHRGENDRGREFCDIELILRDEAHIERFAEAGEVLHERAEKAALEALRSLAQQDVPLAASVSQQEALAQRQRLREMAASMAGRKISHAG